MTIRISWGDQEQIKLKEGADDLIHSVSEVVHYPVSLFKNVTVPPRTVASVVTLTDLPEPETKILYKMITADDPPDPGGSAITYPLCYATMVGGKQKCAQIVVNLGQEKVTIKNGTILGYLERWADEAANNPDTSENDWINTCRELMEESEEEPFSGAEMGFLKSPADVDPREPIVLKDAEVLPEAQKSFDSLCDEFADTFSKDLSDLGKTPLLKMNIPSGDSPLVSQKTIYLSSETCTVGMRGDRDTGESRGNCMECITLGEPHSDSAQEDRPRQTTQASHVCGLLHTELPPGLCRQGTFKSQGDTNFGTHPKDRRNLWKVGRVNNLLNL